MKKFISIIPLQDPLESAEYKAIDCDKAKAICKSRFPIISLIANNVKEGEVIKLVINSIDNPVVVKNKKLFFEEVDALAAEINFKYDVSEIEKVDNEKTETHLKLFSDLLDEFEENDEIFACITYGTKPLSVVVNMALNYAYKSFENVYINTIIYGLITDRDLPQKGEIYDVTSLFYMDSIVNELAGLKIKNPKLTIREMLNLNEKED